MKNLLKVLLVFSLVVIHHSTSIANSPPPNFIGDITSITLSNANECALSTYTIQAAGVNDPINGTSQRPIGSFCYVVFPQGTDVTCASSAEIIINSISYNLTISASSTTVLEFLLPAYLPGGTGYTIIVHDIINPPLINCSGSPNIYYSLCTPGVLYTAMIHPTNYSENLYHHYPNGLYEILPAPYSVSIVKVDKPVLTSVIVGANNRIMLRVKVHVGGSFGTLPNLESMSFNTATMPIQNINKARLWYSQDRDFFNASTDVVIGQKNSITNVLNYPSTQTLQGGHNYFFLVYDVACVDNIIGSHLDGTFQGVLIDGQVHQAPTPTGTRLIEANNVFSSANLVPNPSFEDHTSCNIPQGNLTFVDFWSNIPYSGTPNGTPDYLNVCSTIALTQIPSNDYAYQYARTGDAYIGMTGDYGTQNWNWTEFVQVPLKSPLIANKTYTVSYYVSAGIYDRKHNGQGFHFSISPLTPVPNNFTIAYPANFANPNINYSDTDWELVQGQYTATGGESILVIGSFLNENNGVQHNGALTFSYYLYDDVSVICDSIPTEVCCAEQPALNFSRSQVTGTNNQGRRVYNFDVNDDNFDDIITTNENLNHGDGVVIKINSGTGTFTNVTSYLSNVSIESLDFKDVNGDGLEDLVCQGFNDLFILKGLGTSSINNGSFDVPEIQSINTTGSVEYRGGFEMADFNGDFLDDLVVLNGNANQVLIYYRNANNASPYFGLTVPGQPDQILQTNPVISYWEAKAYDINNDFLTDLIVPMGGGSNDILIFMNLGSSLATTPVTISTSGGNWPRGVDVADFDLDGNPNIITACQLSKEVIVSQNILITSLIPGTLLTPNWDRYPTSGYQPVGIALQDIDNDSDLDIITAMHSPSSKVRVLLQDGGHLFNNHNTYNSMGVGSATDVAISRFNDDCCWDIVTSNWPGNSSNPGSSTLYINFCDTLTYSISGTVFCAPDNGCIGTNPLPFTNVQLQDPNSGTSYYVQTDINGNYSFLVPQSIANYNVTLPNSHYHNPCAATIGYPYLGIIANNYVGLNFIAENNCDIDVNISGGFAGFFGNANCPYTVTPCNNLMWQYCVEFQNNTCMSIDVDSFTLSLPTGIAFVQSIGQLRQCTTTNYMIPGQANTTNATSINWSLANPYQMLPGECLEACVTLKFGSNLPPNPSVTANAFFECNNIMQQSLETLSYADTCSCDPNFKSVYPLGCGPQHALVAQPLFYRVQFQNIGSGPAFNIRLEDQLDSDLDWNTFQLTGSNLSYSNLSISPNGMLEVNYNNIQLSPGGIGWITYVMEPLANLPNATTITNEANIFFDNNSPVSTNMVSNLIIEKELYGIIQPECTTVYKGYPPSECALLETKVQGGVPPYNYQWSTSETTSNISVCPMTTTTYQVTVTDAVGCIIVLESIVYVVDVECKKDKVSICTPTNKPGGYKQECVPISQVPKHLDAGGYLGICGQVDSCGTLGNKKLLSNHDIVIEEDLSIYPNPSNGLVSIKTITNSIIAMNLYNINGVLIRTWNTHLNNNMDIDITSEATGIYLLRISFDNGTIESRELIVY